MRFHLLQKLVLLGLVAYLGLSTEAATNLRQKVSVAWPSAWSAATAAAEQHPKLPSLVSPELAEEIANIKAQAHAVAAQRGPLWEKGNEQVSVLDGGAQRWATSNGSCNAVQDPVWSLLSEEAARVKAETRAADQQLQDGYAKCEQHLRRATRRAAAVLLAENVLPELEGIEHEPQVAGAEPSVLR